MALPPGLADQITIAYKHICPDLQKKPMPKDATFVAHMIYINEELAKVEKELNSSVAVPGWDRTELASRTKFVASRYRKSEAASSAAADAEDRTKASKEMLQSIMTVLITNMEVLASPEFQKTFQPILQKLKSDTTKTGSSGGNPQKPTILDTPIFDPNA